MTATTAERPAARLIDRTELRRVSRQLRPMGTQPALDGIRAVSVVLVILYHAGFAWVHGGFFGVEVFFVVSGYLITSLLWEERARNGRVSLRHFWLRRARRLLPALTVVLLGSSLWALWFAGEHVELLRRDLLPAIAYVGNWGQIFGSVPYFSPADPLLRHVWSLAVEEQWYLLWPLAFVGLMRVARSNPRVTAAVLASTAALIALWSAIAASSTRPTISVLGRDPDRFNFLYLNTITRSSGLLLGAALAMVWRPWSRASRYDVDEDAVERDGRVADGVGVGAVALIALIAVTRGGDILADASLYRIWLPLVTLLSAAAVAAAVHPQATVVRRVFGQRWVVAIGQRSYGLYLWHWPVFVFAGVRADHSRFLPAMLITAGLSELCYRLVETPIRQGALGRWWSTAGVRTGSHRGALVAASAGCAVLALVVLGARLASFEPEDAALDTSEVAFDPGAVAGEPGLDGTESDVPTRASGGPAIDSAIDASSGSSPASGPAIAPTADDAVPATTAAGPGTSVPTAATVATPAALPRSVVLVGDSQAHSLAINLPSGIEETFTISDGSLDGCGVWDSGNVVSQRSSFRRSFADCAGWQQEWADAVTSSGADVALVVLGAWDVFDVRVGETLIAFGSPQSDDLFRQHLQSGVDALVAAGAHAALLEVPCMRPVDVEGAGVPALPERGDDARVAHLNELIREVAAANPGRATFVPGPAAWCADPVVASDRGYRWDGVHAYKPGAKLVFETIAASLLAIPV